MRRAVPFKVNSDVKLYDGRGRLLEVISAAEFVRRHPGRGARDADAPDVSEVGRGRSRRWASGIS